MRTKTLKKNKTTNQKHKVQSNNNKLYVILPYKETLRYNINKIISKLSHGNNSTKDVVRIQTILHKENCPNENCSNRKLFKWKIIQ